MARILITEDDPAIRQILQRVLNAEGHVVSSAASGEAAWTQIKKSQPDCLVLDLGLPGINGREVYRRIKEAGLSLPIIVVTATATPSEALADMPHTPVISKPFDLDQLILTIDWLLRRTSHQPGSENEPQPKRGQARVRRRPQTV